ncbi:hypothetical protein EVAR_20638_1 [Eumeta japonica]|uniref:Uncharacterized protein n=1 Tax=Eumeta variegata TaxID=151549 RepID=A0A4C1VCW8_EUMVA|nr:hypothetical protein EVAR_20638_1 [Eumeta japonica]
MYVCFGTNRYPDIRFSCVIIMNVCVCASRITVPMPGTNLFYEDVIMWKFDVALMSVGRLEDTNSLLRILRASQTVRRDALGRCDIVPGASHVDATESSEPQGTLGSAVRIVTNIPRLLLKLCNQSATAIRKDLSSGDLLKLGKVNACSYVPGSGAFRLDFSAASKASFNSSSKVV